MFSKQNHQSSVKPETIVSCFQFPFQSPFQSQHPESVSNPVDSALPEADNALHHTPHSSSNNQGDDSNGDSNDIGITSLDRNINNHEAEIETELPQNTEEVETELRARNMEISQRSAPSHSPKPPMGMGSGCHLKKPRGLPSLATWLSRSSPRTHPSDPYLHNQKYCQTMKTRI
ncbi:unnamed protein product [Fraxinus pennsylvanica]|uniref:Uncharacterized protein n=1 Tax=Fraxinus pennsylvanica TaxID=56036 RepID=A0AAD2A639_9LAMI|nr:unnamed protein product [Fraxinus pennsylvanica]